MTRTNLESCPPMHAAIGALTSAMLALAPHGQAQQQLNFSINWNGPTVSAPDCVTGGVSPFPGIMYAAENLGLATARSGLTATDFGEQLLPRPLFDCNGNGIEDAVDIAMGFSIDTDMNGIPDECEGATAASSCFCSDGVAPRVNGYPSVGCANSTAVVAERRRRSRSSERFLDRTPLRGRHRGTTLPCRR